MTYSSNPFVNGFSFGEGASVNRSDRVNFSSFGAAADSNNLIGNSAAKFNWSGNRCVGWNNEKNIPGGGKIAFDNGDVYEGQFQLNGIGRMTHKDGRVSQGIWDNGKLVYEGDVNDNGEPHGNGKWTYPNRDVYEGQWANGKRHGVGTYKSSDGYFYNGGWQNDKKHGRGTRNYPTGLIEYSGEYQNDLHHGNGSLSYNGGDVYSGEFRAGKRHGRGVMNYINQYTVEDKYDGEWKNGLKDGTGTMTYKNGDVYRGEFRSGKMHGKGTFEYASGEICKSVGDWKEGEKFGLFEDTVRVTKQVYYGIDDDTQAGDGPSRKRRNVSVSPS